MSSLEAGTLSGQIFMVGTGGQGILLLARALAQIALLGGRPVISSETHGMAMRGGTVTASLKVGDYASPLIPAGSADVLIGLDEAETRGFLPMLGPGGVSVVNAQNRGACTHAIDATGMALDAGLPGAVNMVMLGFALRVLGIPIEQARAAVGDISPGRSLDANLTAMGLGYGHSPETAS